MYVILPVQVEKKQFEKILSYIEHGKREGATLLAGGKRFGEKGYYIEPTIFTDVKVHTFLFVASNLDMMVIRNHIVVSWLFKLGFWFSVSTG